MKVRWHYLGCSAAWAWPLSAVAHGGQSHVALNVLEQRSVGIGCRAALPTGGQPRLGQRANSALTVTTVSHAI
jgi:hypothetical protein